MNYFLFIIVFVLMLFLYLHIVFHLKTSNDLEVYEIDMPSKNKLEEICDLRQPVIFRYENPLIMETCGLTDIVDNYSAFDINIRNKNNDDKTEMYIPLVLKEAIDLFTNDKDKTYLSMNNSEFLEETGIIKRLSYNDEFLRPQMVAKCNYDLLSGSIGTTTPLMHNLNYRNYYMLTQGDVTIKLIPPHSSRYLYSETDYLNFEFRSPINPWDIQSKYKADFDKIKTLDVELKKGDIIHIPAYWWFSIKYNRLSSICNFSYRTYMNTLALSPYLSIHMLQKTNVKREIVKKKDDVIISKNESSKENKIE